LAWLVVLPTVLPATLPQQAVELRAGPGPDGAGVHLWVSDQALHLASKWGSPNGSSWSSANLKPAVPNHSERARLMPKSAWSILQVVLWVARLPGMPRRVARVSHFQLVPVALQLPYHLVLRCPPCRAEMATAVGVASRHRGKLVEAAVASVRCQASVALHRMASQAAAPSVAVVVAEGSMVSVVVHVGARSIQQER